MVERTLEFAVAHHLLGSLVHVVGYLEIIRHGCPFTKSLNPSRQWMVLLTNVQVSDWFVDHLWLQGCQKIMFMQDLPKGTLISLYGRIKTYMSHGQMKWTLSFPYQTIQVAEPSQLG